MLPRIYFVEDAHCLVDRHRSGFPEEIDNSIFEKMSSTASSIEFDMRNQASASTRLRTDIF